jgi:hypothetical protein
MRQWCFRFIVAIALAMFPTEVVSETILDIKVVTEQKIYQFGETVYFFLDACNPTDQPYSEIFTCSCRIFKIVILDGNDRTVAYYEKGRKCPQIPIKLSWKPKECRSYGPFTWLQIEGGFPYPGAGVQVSPGEYRIRAKWENGSVAESTLFTIMKKQPPLSEPTISKEGIIFIVIIVAGLGCIVLFFMLRRR